MHPTSTTNRRVVRAIILLHEPHARVERGIGVCPSSFKIYMASHSILDLIVNLRSGTSYDITLLEPSAVVSSRYLSIFYILFLYFVSSKSRS